MKPSGCFFESRAKLPIICETTKHLHCYFVKTSSFHLSPFTRHPQICTNHFLHFFYLCFVKLQRQKRKSDMNELMKDLWPFLMTAVVAVIGWQWKESHTIKVRVAVLEQTIEDLMKTVDSIQKRQDSHSKKQDDILKAIADLKVDIVKQLSATEKQMSAITTKQEMISADVQTIKRTISIIEKEK